MGYVNTDDLYHFKKEIEKMINESEKRIIEHIDSRTDKIEEGVDYVRYGGTLSKYVNKNTDYHGETFPPRSLIDSFKEGDDE